MTKIVIESLSSSLLSVVNKIVNHLRVETENISNNEGKCTIEISPDINPDKLITFISEKLR
jgi:hypothetical protein